MPRVSPCVFIFRSSYVKPLRTLETRVAATCLVLGRSAHTHGDVSVHLAAANYATGAINARYGETTRHRDRSRRAVPATSERRFRGPRHSCGSSGTLLPITTTATSARGCGCELSRATKSDRTRRRIRRTAAKRDRTPSITRAVHSFHSIPERRTKETGESESQRVRARAHMHTHNSNRVATATAPATIAAT